jgi:hypothetical protein
MRLRRWIPKYCRKIPDADIARIESALDVRLPDAYRQTLRDNPLAYSRSNLEPNAVCMNAEIIIEYNLCSRSEGYYGRNWPLHYLWIGDDYGGGAYFLKTDSDLRVFYVNWESNDHQLDDLETLDSWPTLHRFLEQQLREAAEDRGTPLENALSAAHRARGKLLDAVWKWKSEQALRDGLRGAERFKAVPTLEVLSGTYLFEEKSLGSGYAISIRNYWIFYPDSTLRNVTIAGLNGHFVRTEDFGEYRIEDKIIRVTLPDRQGKTDLDFQFLDPQRLLGYTNSLGRRVPDDTLP